MQASENGDNGFAGPGERAYQHDDIAKDFAINRDAGGGNSGRDNVTNAIAKADKLRSLYYEKFGALVGLQMDIEKAIEPLPAEDQMMLRMYYFSNYTWEEVAVRMGINWRSVHRRHAAILERLAQDEEEKKETEPENQ